MHRLKMILVACVIVTVVATLSLTAGKAKASPLSCGTWSVVNNNAPGYFNSVAAQSADDVWAVGNVYFGSHSYMQIMNWTGSSTHGWVSSVPGSQGSFLYGAAVQSTSNFWAVGYYDNSSGVAQTLTENWNGSSWSQVSSPNVGSNNNALYSVTAISASNVWAVGEYYNGSAGQTLIEHWDGTSWTLVSSPNRGSHGNFLYSVTALSASNIWAVGYYINGSADQTLTEHWNGGTWSLVSSPNVGSSSNALDAVASVPGTSSMWAVGYYINGSADQILTEYYC